MILTVRALGGELTVLALSFATMATKSKTEDSTICLPLEGSFCSNQGLQTERELLFKGKEKKERKKRREH